MDVASLSSAAANTLPQSITAVQQVLTTAPLVDRLRTILPAASDTPILDRLALPEDHLQRLGPVLQNTGLDLAVAEGQLQSSDGTTTFRFTEITGNGHRKALLYIGGDVLTRYTRSAKLALEEVRDTFQGKYDNRLYVFFDTEPVALFKNLMQDEWCEKYQITVVFVPLRNVTDFDDMAMEQRVKYVRRVLELDAAAAPKLVRQPAERMAVAELNRLRKQIVPELAQFETSHSRMVFVEGDAQLLPFAKEFNFEGNRGTVASDLVMKLWESHLLGRLLEMLKNLDDIPPDHRQFVCYLLDRYTFTAPDPGGP